MPKPKQTQSSKTGPASLSPATVSAQGSEFVHSRLGHRLAYKHSEGKGGTTGNAAAEDKAAKAGLFFLCGFHSDMNGSKAQHLQAHANERGLACTRFDYSGHGESEGSMAEGTIGQWLADALDVFDQVTQGPQIVVGSSMGGWLALLLAMQRPERVVGLVGLASAPDFTEALLWDKLTDQQQKTMLRKGWIDLPSQYDEKPYRVTTKFLEESTEHFVLDKPSIPVFCPVTLLHGINDTEVPFEFSMAINEKLESKQVRTMLIPDGDHRLSSDRHLRAMSNAIEKMRGFLAENAAAISARPVNAEPVSA